MGLLGAVSDLTKTLAGLGLVGALFKPLPGLIDGLTPAVQGLAHTLGIDGVLHTLGLDLHAMPHSFAYNVNGDGAFKCGMDLGWSYDGGEIVNVTFAPFDSRRANIMRYRQQMAVNLGSWFVVEPWMTPSLFLCAAGNQTAELDVANGWGTPDNAKQVLERHWDSFINETDFAYLAAVGINTVRIPIGYWTLGPDYLSDTPFANVSTVYSSAYPRLLRAINAAAAHDIGVIVDLHGAPGSQNGQLSSGVSDGVVGLFNNATYQQKTVDALTFLVKELAPVTNVVGLQLLNEPAPNRGLKDWYEKTIETLRAVSDEAKSLPLYVHDSFDIKEYADWVGKREDFIVEDHHAYFIPAANASTTSVASTKESASKNQFKSLDERDSDDDSDSDDGETALSAKEFGSHLSDAADAANRNLIIGEFSCALANSSIPDGQNATKARKQFCDAQLRAYQNVSAGWGFWSYKSEQCTEGWCFIKAVGTSLPSTFSSYSSDFPINATITSSSGSAPVAPGAAAASGASLTDLLAGLTPPTLDSILANAVNSTLLKGLTARSDDKPAGLLKRWQRTLTAFRQRAIARARARGHGRVHARSFNVDMDSIYVGGSSSRNGGLNAAVLVGRRDESGTMTSEQQAIAKGYSDGFETARSFAEMDLSKLGFVHQYVEDSIKAMAKMGDGALLPGQEDTYRQWFSKGLSDGEELVAQAAAAYRLANPADAVPAPVIADPFIFTSKKKSSSDSDSDSSSPVSAARYLAAEPSSTDSAAASATATSSAASASATATESASASVSASSSAASTAPTAARR